MNARLSVFHLYTVSFVMWRLPSGILFLPYWTEQWLKSVLLLTCFYYDTLFAVSCLIEPLLDLRNNPIYAVRVAAARALVPVVQEKNCYNLLLQLILDLPRGNERVSHNMLHGQLQHIYALLSSVLKGNWWVFKLQSATWFNILSPIDLNHFLVLGNWVLCQIKLYFLGIKKHVVQIF